MTEKRNAPAEGAQQAKDFNNKDSYKSQYIKTLEAFCYPKTMMMASMETGIDRANICRYVDVAVKLGSLFLINYGFCTITAHYAGFYCTDKSLINIPMQLELFPEKGGDE